MSHGDSGGVTPTFRGGYQGGAELYALKTKLVLDPNALSAFAEAASGTVMPLQMEHDLRWLAQTDHGSASKGAALLLYRDTELVGYVPIRHRSGRLRLRLGEVTVTSLPYSTLQLFGYGVLGEGEGIVEATVDALSRASLRYDAITLQDTPTDSPLFRALSEGKAGKEFIVVDRGRAVHHVVELPASFREYLERFTSKRRNGFRRTREKITAEIGPVELSVFARKDEMRPMLEVIGPVSTKTFQHRLFGQNLTLENEQLARNLETWAGHGWVRAYVLRAGGDVLAYVIGFLIGNRYHYELVGYDPARAAYSPGNVLLLHILEELIESRIANVLDFGAGDAEYKRFFGTSSYEEANLMLTRRTFYAQNAAGLERSFAFASRVGAETLDRLGWKRKVKAFLRSSEVDFSSLWKSRPKLPAGLPTTTSSASHEAHGG